MANTTTTTTTNHRNLAIILGAALGSLTLVLLLGTLCYLRRRQSRGSLLTRRCVTPLSDAEFESWRRPSKQIQWREKLSSPSASISAAFPASPPPALTRFPSTSSRHRPSSMVMLEKDLGVPVYEYRPRPIRTPDGFRKADRAWDVGGHRRCKSSMSTIQSVVDRPPTPYSPTGSISTRPHERVSSMSPKLGHVHYPSVSEASDFDFGFRGDGAYGKI
ncbi:hypothetical protein K490DRAFT_37959 [Saccharata proteae CBS 121410]|uniref:Uncharacterized protein n=1 Tax=Saccharata proteae CBS 121410 TaxID=1314787 RepID=A0A6A5YB98_9PEZI|nr:hypothetical protein K490DRAFT_37959 [Saccharata proteae CBS 121410]